MATPTFLLVSFSLPSFCPFSFPLFIIILPSHSHPSFKRSSSPFFPPFLLFVPLLVPLLPSSSFCLSLLHSSLLLTLFPSFPLYPSSISSLQIPSTTPPTPTSLPPSTPPTGESSPAVWLLKMIEPHLPPTRENKDVDGKKSLTNNSSCPLPPLKEWLASLGPTVNMLPREGELRPRAASQTILVGSS